MSGAKWEDIPDQMTSIASGEAYEHNGRLKVPGGWIYRSMLFEPGFSPAVAMVFVPDGSSIKGH